ncbi:hypothetical protein RHMOL_Rhmol04G0111800 [Rhododendron molle]|uniref:Uncharacterized protein n=1 Tax=Rhododendron molle TaxID=49168 RepID=A0ACC0NZ21_RHOML|nr:hypothetical protein RHMOL_Rhmol04G0111800 [Rhododendron molle]
MDQAGWLGRRCFAQTRHPTRSCRTPLPPLHSRPLQSRSHTAPFQNEDFQHDGDGDPDHKPAAVAPISPVFCNLYTADSEIAMTAIELL